MHDTTERPGADAEKLRTTIERNIKAMTLRPSFGLGTGVSRCRLTNGLAVEVTEGNWKFSSDMPAAAGGKSSAPTPGVYGRAALGSCLAMSYAMCAAREGIPIAGIEVEVQADYDDGASFGITPNPPGYLEVRYTVTIESDAPAETIRNLIDNADAHSPYLDVFSRAQRCRRELRIVPPSGGAR